jgi:hypothetical protein
MKKTLTKIILAVCVLVLPGMAQAAMKYYSFQGSVSSDPLSSTIDFQDKSFSAVFAVDVDGIGSSTDLNGVKTEYPDTTDGNGFVTSTTDNFYAELVSTNFRLMPGTASRFDACGTNITVQLSMPGFERTDIMPSLTGTGLDGANFADSTSSFRVMIQGAGSFVQDWALGSVLGVYLDSIVAGGEPIHGTEFTDMASGQLTLTAISNTKPAVTPIPGAIWLLGSGVVGLIGMRRKMKA